MRKLARAKPVVKRELPDMNVSTYGEWLASDLDDVPELVKGLIPAVGCGFFAGVPKCGKTWAVLDLALAGLAGQTFMSRATTQLDRPVLYLAGEGGVLKLLRRIGWLANGRGIGYNELRDRLHLSIAPRVLLDRRDGIEALEQTIKKIQPGLVIIDPLTRFHTADENSRSDIEGPILTPLRQISEEYETCVMVVHHSPKWHGGRFDPLRGTSAFQGWFDFLLYFEPATSGGFKNGNGNGHREENEGEIEGYRFAAQLRDNEEPPKRDLVLDIDALNEKARIFLSSSAESVPTALAEKSSSLDRRILMVLEHKHAMSISSIRKILKRNRDHVETKINEMMKDGLLEQVSEGGVIKYRISE